VRRQRVPVDGLTVRAAATGVKPTACRRGRPRRRAVPRGCRTSTGLLFALLWPFTPPAHRSVACFRFRDPRARPASVSATGPERLRVEAAIDGVAFPSGVDLDDGEVEDGETDRNGRDREHPRAGSRRSGRLSRPAARPRPAPGNGSASTSPTSNPASTATVVPPGSLTPLLTGGRQRRETKLTRDPSVGRHGRTHHRSARPERDDGESQDGCPAGGPTDARDPATDEHRTEPHDQLPDDHRGPHRGSVPGREGPCGPGRVREPDRCRARDDRHTQSRPACVDGSLARTSADGRTG
jgi:hypothetical protein